MALAHLRGESLEGATVEVDVTGTVYLARVQQAAAFDPRGLRMRERTHHV